MEVRWSAGSCPLSTGGAPACLLSVLPVSFHLEEGFCSSLSFGAQRTFPALTFDDSATSLYSRTTKLPRFPWDPEFTGRDFQC